jgi:sarcosine oxidase subunit beta
MAGLLVARDLRRLGVGRVVVLERDVAGHGMTGRSSGGIRRQFATPLEVQLTLAAWPFFEQVLADPAFSGRFERLGYAFLAGPAEVERLRAAWQVQRALGVASEWLEPAQLHERFPYCATDDLAGGTYCPDDGFIDPWETHAWLLHACRTLGVEVREGSEVSHLDPGPGGHVVVESGPASWSAEAVVVCAGAWARGVVRLAGADVEIDPSPRVKLVTDPLPALPADMPLITDLGSGAYVRSDHGRAMVGVSPRQRRVSFAVEAGQDLLASMAETAAGRFPSLAEASLAHLITGLYEITPDGLPIAGRLVAAPGLYVLGGLNGHGIMHSPPLARALAELIVTGRPTRYDLGPFEPGRIVAAGQAKRSTTLL